MARKQGWAIFITFLVGIAAASFFWLYGPYYDWEVGRRVAEETKGRQVTLEVSKGGGAALQGAPAAALGLRYQLVAGGSQTFLADLKEGRVWRYFHHTREGGYAREEEGFLPVPLYFEGKKHYTAGELDQPQAAKPGEQPPASAGER
jgi:hypothetical protein